MTNDGGGHPNKVAAAVVRSIDCSVTAVLGLQKGAFGAADAGSGP
jgi:hypothetical protein